MLHFDANSPVLSSDSEYGQLCTFLQESGGACSELDRAVSKLPSSALKLLRLREADAATVECMPPAAVMSVPQEAIVFNAVKIDMDHLKLNSMLDRADMSLERNPYGVGHCSRLLAKANCRVEDCSAVGPGRGRSKGVHQSSHVLFAGDEWADDCRNNAGLKGFQCEHTVVLNRL